MTRTARLVLEDAKYAIDRHSDDLQGADFRISWLSVVTLLRAVGHVLKDVDAKSSPAMGKAVRQQHEILVSPEPAIFWHFIKGARDNFLKEYVTGVSRTRSKLITHPSGKTFSLSLDAGSVRGVTIAPMDAAASVVKDGPFAGRPEKEVALQAYEWWRKYLDEVDELAKT